MTEQPEDWGRTRTGRVITDAMVEEWAAEAERGYDVEPLLERQRQERQRMVGDAILLERALRVVERRFKSAIQTDAHVHAVAFWLRWVAADLRREGEYGVTQAAAAGGPHPPAAGLDYRGPGQEGTG